jgi:hypothetical protein
VEPVHAQANQTKPNQTKPNQTKPNQTKKKPSFWRRKGEEILDKKSFKLWRKMNFIYFAG